MEHTASIPAWVARRGWNRNNPLWVRMWLERKPRAKRSGTDAVDAPISTATILPFAREQRRD